MHINKKSIQVIILIVVILAVGFYFFNEFYLSKRGDNNKKSSFNLEEMLQYKIVRQDLTAEQIKGYQDKFDKYKELLLGAPDNFDFNFWNGLAMTKKIVGDFIGAETIWKYMSYMRPANSLSPFNLANLYAEDLKDNQKAEEQFILTLEKSKAESANEQYYRGVADFYTYYYQEKKTKLEKILLEALQSTQYQNNQTILSLLATYYQNNGEPDEALKYWQQVLVLDPNNTGVKAEIERLKK